MRLNYKFWSSILIVKILVYGAVYRPVGFQAKRIILVLITGIVDLLGGLGMVLPVALRIKPVLTVWATYGIVVLMIVASIFHISRGEAQNIGINIVFLLLAVFVARGRRKERHELSSQ